MTGVDVRPATEGDWAIFRSIRLQALADAPTAFGSTLAREQQFDDDTWRRRARGTTTSRMFLAWMGDTAVGVAGVYDEGDGSVQIVSVWVAPAHRGRGVAAALTGAALRFAAANAVDWVRLWVTEGNGSARRLYERLGFTPTGRRQPLPSEPSLEEHELELQLGQPQATAPA